MREILVSPDGNSVAIRSDHDPEAWNAWGVMNGMHGGHWSATSELWGWQRADLTGETLEKPEPDPVPDMPPPIPAEELPEEGPVE